MRTVWKFPISVADTIEFSAPIGSKVLAVQTQFGDPCIWMEVPDDQGRTEVRKFRTYGTGHEVDDNMTYLGTYQVHGGNCVFHLYEEVAG